jgi:hypothetical protein
MYNSINIFSHEISRNGKYRFTTHAQETPHSTTTNILSVARIQFSSCAVAKIHFIQPIPSPGPHHTRKLRMSGCISFPRINVEIYRTDIILINQTQVFFFKKLKRTCNSRVFNST